MNNLISKQLDVLGGQKIL